MSVLRLRHVTLSFKNVMIGILCLYSLFEERDIYCQNVNQLRSDNTTDCSIEGSVTTSTYYEYYDLTFDSGNGDFISSIDIEMRRNNVPYFSYACTVSLVNCNLTTGASCNCYAKVGNTYKIQIITSEIAPQGIQDIRPAAGSYAHLLQTDGYTDSSSSYKVYVLSTNNEVATCPINVSYSDIIRFDCYRRPCHININFNGIDVASGIDSITYQLPTSALPSITHNLGFSFLPCGRPTSEINCAVTVITASNSVSTTSQPLTFTNGNVHQDYTCYFGYMDVHIPVSLTPNAKLWLRDRTCQLYNNGSHYVINVPYSSCGTLIQEEGDYTVMTNEITVHTEFEPSLPVSFGDDYTIDLKCTIPKHQEVTGSFQAVTGEPVLVTGENKTQGYQLKEFETADYLKEITRYPVQIPINKEMYFEVSLNEDDRKNSSLGVFVDECRAMPSLDPNDPLNFVLLTNGCPKTQAVHVLDSPGPEVFRFSVHGFHFTGSDNHDGFVYIHCDVTACPRNTCVQGCSQTTGRRKRRSGARSHGKLIIGPYIIINNVRH